MAVIGRIIGDNGRVQFDRSLMSITLAGKGSGQTQSRYGSNTSPSTALVPFDPASQLIVAIRCGATMANGGFANVNGTNYAIFQCQGGVGTGFDYYIFERNSKRSPASFGLNFWDDAGNLTFSSDADYLVLANVLNGLGAVANLDGSRQYAAILPTWSGIDETTDSLYKDGQPFLDDGNDDGQQHYWERNVNGKLYGVRFPDRYTAVTDTVSYDDVRGQTPGYANRPDPPTTYWSRDLQNVLIIDVTGF